MQFTIYKDNGGQFHWRLVGDDGIPPVLLARRRRGGSSHATPLEKMP